MMYNALRYCVGSQKHRLFCRTGFSGRPGTFSAIGGLDMEKRQISDYLKPGRHVHLVGIGGVSMRPLGLVLKGMGMVVTG